MPIYKCSKCIPTNVPDELTMEQKSYVASLVRESEPILVMHEIKDFLKLPLIDAKNIALHVTTVKGHCHRCSNSFSIFEGNCPKCNILNLDW
jgi:hypothetical protein